MNSAIDFLWVNKTLDKAIQPLRNELDCLKKEFMHVKQVHLNRISVLEESLEEIVGNSKKFAECNQPDAATANQNNLGNKKTLKMSSSIEYSVDGSDEADKTGFARIRARALMKAVQCQNVSQEVTLGPNAAPNIWFPSPNADVGRTANTGVGLGGSVDLDLTPIPKATTSRKKELKAVRLIAADSDEEDSVDKEVFYEKRILADLNQLSLKEAQENMRLNLKKWEEHDAKVLELLAQRKAQQQAEELARQQTKIAEMARMQEEYIKKQQELDAAQAMRDKEFYRRHEENKKQQLEVERLQREKVKYQSDSIQRIFYCFSNFSSKYREILEMFQRHEELKNSAACDLEVIKSCHEKFNTLIAKCKLNQVDEEDVRCAQHLLNEVTAFNCHARKEVEKTEQAKQKEREQQAEHQKRIEEDKLRKKREEEKKHKLQAGDGSAMFSDSTSAQVETRNGSVISYVDQKSMRDMGPFEATSSIIDPTDPYINFGSRNTTSSLSSMFYQCCLAYVVAHSGRYKSYLTLRQNHDRVEKAIEDLTKNESLRKFRIDLQKAVNIPLNAISSASSSHLHDKYKKLSSLIQNQTVVISDKRISASSHPLGSLYAMDYLALKTVKQGEQCVSSNPEAAYPIAAVLVAIWTELPEFGKLLLAHFYRASPYLIPAYWNREASESDEDYYTRLGFKYANGEQEEMDKFLKRQSGIMRLYCAIIVTPQNKANRYKPHPLPLSEAWKWLTCFISLPPKADISATLLLEMLEITGHLMMQTFPKQFRKLLHLICISYLPLVEKVTPAGRSGPVARLRVFLEGLISGKSIPPPKGLLPPNFW